MFGLLISRTSFVGVLTIRELQVSTRGSLCSYRAALHHEVASAPNLPPAASAALKAAQSREAGFQLRCGAT